MQEELQEVFPDARIVRMDVDTTRPQRATRSDSETVRESRSRYFNWNADDCERSDYPNVTLVGVINADTALNIPDFRSSEKTFQLLTQVSRTCRTWG